MAAERSTNAPASSLPDSDMLPWYRYTWPWVLIAIPFAAVLFGILMIYMVTRYPDDLMVDNYYKEGMAINQSLAMDAAAQALNVEAVLLKVDAEQIQFAVQGVTGTEASWSLSYFMLPTRRWIKDGYCILNRARPNQTR